MSIMMGMRNKEMLRYWVLIVVFMLSATVSAQAKELPDFTELIKTEIIIRKLLQSNKSNIL